MRVTNGKTYKLLTWHSAPFPASTLIPWCLNHPPFSWSLIPLLLFQPSFEYFLVSYENWINYFIFLNKLCRFFNICEQNSSPFYAHFYLYIRNGLCSDANSRTLVSKTTHLFCWKKSSFPIEPQKIFSLYILYIV